ncbi:agmatine deiminase family protein [Humibacter soli]
MTSASDARPDEESLENSAEAPAAEHDEVVAVDVAEVEVTETEIFAVGEDGEITEVEVVETEIVAVDANGEVVDVVEVTETFSVTDAAWRMPAETDGQQRVWMAFPPAGGYLGETAEDVDDARTAWSEVAHSILRFEPVSMVVDPHDIGVARRYLSTEIDIVAAPLDDAWMRDIGPTFVRDEDGRLGAVTWRFNGWGAQDWARWGNDSVIGALVAVRAGATRVVSSLVNEGGGIHVDGLGTVLLTETVQLDPKRNPDLTKEDVETELARTIGATNPIWLRRGLYRDAKRFGTRGHVDIVATIPSPGRILVHSQQDETHPDHEITVEAIETLRASRTPDGEEWEIIELPAPQVLRDEEDFVDYSYINHLVIDGAVIVGTFDDPNDEVALNILAEAYEGREIVGVDARAIFARGGGIHCITQQQPSVG